MKIDERYGEVGMQKCQVIFDRALTTPYVIRDNPRIKGTKILASLILKAYQLSQTETLLYPS